MSFIRAKEIPPRSGNWYDYEVKTVHEGKKVIQKYIRYIGKSTLRASRSSVSSRYSIPHPVAESSVSISSSESEQKVEQAILAIKQKGIP